jgi:hypothetical protein
MARFSRGSYRSRRGAADVDQSASVEPPDVIVRAREPIVGKARGGDAVRLDDIDVQGRQPLMESYFVYKRLPHEQRASRTERRHRHDFRLASRCS